MTPKPMPNVNEAFIEGAVNERESKYTDPEGWIKFFFFFLRETRYITKAFQGHPAKLAKTIPTIELLLVFTPHEKVKTFIFDLFLTFWFVCLFFSKSFLK